MTRRQRRANFFAILIGLAVTAAVLAVYLAGYLDRFEWIALDWRFRYCNSLEPSDEIVCLDITDRDLEAVGRWPWSRDLQAPLVAIPAEMGARTIVVDLTWTEHESTRPAPLEDADVTVDLSELAHGEPPRRVFADSILSHAVAGAGNVYLAYHYYRTDLERSDEFHRLVDMLLEHDSAAPAFAAEIERSSRARIHDDEKLADQRPLDRARIVVALLDDPDLDQDALAAKLGITDGQFLERAIGDCLEAALRRKIVAWLDQQPERWSQPPYELIKTLVTELAGRTLDDDSRVTRALIRAFREILSYAATVGNPPAGLEQLGPIAESVDGIVPVHFAQARAARRCCFANFEPDSDGTVRWVPLAVQQHGHILSQLGFAAAWDQLGVGDVGVIAEPGMLTLKPADESRPPVRVQLDSRGRALIPWVRGREWTRQFVHQPASAVLRLHDLRQNRKKNYGEIARFQELLFSSEFLPKYNETAALLAERPALVLELEAERLKPESDLVEFYEEQLQRIDDAAEQAEQSLRQLIATETPASTQPESGEASERKITDDIRYFLGEIDRLRAAAKTIDAETVQIRERLESVFRDRICVIGYAATSLADMKPIPTHPSAPGALAHANLLNGILTGRTMRWASTGLNATIAVAFGVLATLIGTFLRPRVGGLLVLFAIVAYGLGAGVTAFHNAAYWFAIASVGLATVTPYIAISAYRFVFVDSERRQLATALGQYTSKEIARQVAENPELCRRAEARVVTTMFTDLKGFTTISENIGAERTQQVLNVCLGRFTEIMLRHDAMVNKFLGDGVFAFWNPVIFPQDDHALRACETAVDLITGLEELKTNQLAAGGDEVFGDLVLRIGIATGNAIVGPCGSEQKFDYTCIGDSVNVAARLESANKFYGTRVLLNDESRRQAGDAFAVRPLGGVQVKGKRQAVPIFELLGRAGQVSEDVVAYARHFGDAVEHYQQRRWQEALSAFTTCRETRPDDLAARNYFEAVTRYFSDPPPEDWTGAIELTEK